MNICDSLGLDPLGGIHHKKCPLTCGKGARNFIGKIHMPRSVDEVQSIRFAVLCGIIEGHRMCFDCDSPFPLEIHRIQQLRLHISLRDQSSDLKQAIRKRGLAVVDMRNDTEITNEAGVHRERRNQASA